MAPAATAVAESDRRCRCGLKIYVGQRVQLARTWPAGGDISLRLSASHTFAAAEAAVAATTTVALTLAASIYSGYNQKNSSLATVLRFRISALAGRLRNREPPPHQIAAESLTACGVCLRAPRDLASDFNRASRVSFGYGVCFILFSRAERKPRET